VLVLPKAEPRMPAPKASWMPAPKAGSGREVSQVAFGDDDEPQPKAQGPKGPPPSLAAASIDDKGIHIQESSSGPKPMYVAVEVEKEGELHKVKVLIKNTYFS